MHDLDRVEAQHQVDVARIEACLARDEGRIAVDFDAGERNRGLVLWRGDDGIDFAGARRLNRLAGGEQRRAAARRAGAAEADVAQLLAWTGDERDCVFAMVDVLETLDHPDRRIDPARLRMARYDCRLSEQNGPAQRSDTGVERGLHADLGADPGGVSRRNGNDRQCVGHG
jgi:hypothetical protein